MMPLLSGWRPMALMAVLLAGCAQPQMPEVRGVMNVNSAATDQAATALYETGKAHLLAGRLGLAAEALHAARAARPDSLDVLNALAATYDRFGRFELADRYYREALERSPNDPETLNNWGFSYMLRGQRQKAIAMLEIARRHAPDDGKVAANLALARGAAVSETPADKDALPTRSDVPVLPPRPPRQVWIERRSSGEQALVFAEHQPEPRSSDERSAQITSAPTAVLPPRAETEAPPTDARVARVVPASVQAAGGPSPLRTGPCGLEIANGAGRTRMAARFRAMLAARSWEAQRLTNDASFENIATVIFYREGAADRAAQLASQLPVAVKLEPAADQACSLRLRLGRDLLPFDLDLANQRASETRYAEL